jgi:hypothetical protein
VSERGQDPSDPAVEESLDSWAASSDVPTGWVPQDRPASSSEAPTTVHVVAAASDEPEVEVSAEAEAEIAVEPQPEPGREPEAAAALRAEPIRVGPAPEARAPVDPVYAEPAPVSSRAADAAKLAADRPELVIAGAFVGGLLLAMILKRLAR